MTQGPQQPQPIAWGQIAAVAGTLSAAAGVSVALVTASQQYRLTLDPDIAASAADVAANPGAFMVQAYVESLSGATARLMISDIEAGGTILLECIDPATGALANAGSPIRFVIWRMPPSL